MLLPALAFLLRPRPESQNESMATTCYGARRLSDLLQEQQEPFLSVEAPPCRSAVEACGRWLRRLCANKLFLCGGTGGAALGNKAAVRKALPLRWGDLAVAGCFSCCGGARQRFRRLPRAGDIIGGDSGELDGGGCLGQLGDGRQLSPVSVLELHFRSDDESPGLSHWDEDDDKPSTSATSPPSDHDLPGAATPWPTTFFIPSGGKNRAVDVDGNSNKSSEYSMSMAEKEQAIVSGWERIEADISRIPRLVALELSGSASARGEWSDEEEARRVGQSIEAMIFEEVRWEAVRDMMIC